MNPSEPGREQRGKEREVDKQVNKGEKSKERKPTVASLSIILEEQIRLRGTGATVQTVPVCSL